MTDDVKMSFLDHLEELRKRLIFSVVLMVKDYLSFAIRLIIAFGFIFELPIFISFLAIAGIVNYRQLISFFRYFFVIPQTATE